MNNSPKDLSRTGLWSNRLSTAIVLIAVTVAYIFFLRVPFQYDDVTLIKGNPGIRDLSDLVTVAQSGGGNRPVLLVTYAINYYFGKLDVLGYHLVNLMLHLANVAMVMMLLKRICAVTNTQEGQTPSAGLMSAIGGAIFGLHPIQTESVTYLSSRSTLLCSFFYLAAILFAMNAHMQSGKDRKKETLFLGSAALAYILALGSKEFAITFPAIFVLVDMYFLRKPGNNLRKHLLTRIPFYVLLVVISGAYFGWRFGVLGRFLGEGGRAINIYSRHEYFLIETTILWKYIRLLFFPFNQSAAYDHSQIRGVLFAPRILLGFCGMAALVMLAIVSRKRTPAVSFAIVWFLITLAPTSTVVPVLDVMAERRLYLPMVGFAIVMATWIGKSGLFLTSRTGQVWVQVSLAALIGLILLAGTLWRNTVWLTDYSLWYNTVRNAPGKPEIRNNMGIALHRRGNIDEAINEFRTALRISLSYPTPAEPAPLHKHLGLAYTAKGIEEEAIKHFEKAIEIDPTSALAYSKLAGIYFRREQYDRAAALYRQALDREPSRIHSAYQLGKCLERLGRIEEAISAYRETLEKDAELTVAWYDLGVLLQGKGDLAAAKDAYRQALHTDPNHAPAHVNLGIVYIMENNTEKGVNELLLAVDGDSELWQAHLWLGMVYRRQGQESKAIQHLKKAQELNPDLSLPNTMEELR